MNERSSVVSGVVLVVFYHDVNLKALEVSHKQLSLISDMDVSENRGVPPKSSILIGFSIINHPFWDTPIFGNIHLQSTTATLSSESGTAASGKRR